MCGIFGFVNCGDEYQRKFLAYMNRVRGTEGTGFTWPTENGWKYRKQGCDLCEVMDGKAKIPWDSPVLLGHLRRASPGLKSNGGKCDENAHPFRRMGVILAHNGFIRNWETIQKELRTNKKHKVDSEMLATLVGERDYKALADINGKASVWWAKAQDTTCFYIWCWKQDLSFAEGDGWFAFSSEKKHLVRSGFPDAYVVEDAKGYVVKIDVTTGKMEIIDTVPANDKIDTTEYNGDYWGYGAYGDCQGRVVNSPVVACNKHKTYDGKHVYKWNGNHLVEVKETPRIHLGNVESQCIDPDKQQEENKDSDKDLDFPIGESCTPAYVMNDILHGKSTAICQQCGAFTYSGRCHVCGGKSTFFGCALHYEYCEECRTLFAKRLRSSGCPGCTDKLYDLEDNMDKVKLCMADIAAFESDEFCARMLGGVDDSDTQFIEGCMESMAQDELRLKDMLDDDNAANNGGDADDGDC